MTEYSELTTEDFDVDSRTSDRNRGFLLALPSVVLILLPLFYFVALSVYTGRDEFGPLRDFLNHYHVALFFVMIPCLGALVVSGYLIIVKGVIGQSSPYELD